MLRWLVKKIVKEETECLSKKVQMFFRVTDNRVRILEVKQLKEAKCDKNVVDDKENNFSVHLISGEKISVYIAEEEITKMRQAMGSEIEWFSFENGAVIIRKSEIKYILPTREVEEEVRLYYSGGVGGGYV